MHRKFKFDYYHYMSPDAEKVLCCAADGQYSTKERDNSKTGKRSGRFGMFIKRNKRAFAGMHKKEIAITGEQL